MNFFKQILFLNQFTQFDKNTQECFLDDPLAKLLKWFQSDLQMQFSNESSCMKPKGPELSFFGIYCYRKVLYQIMPCGHKWPGSSGHKFTLSYIRKKQLLLNCFAKLIN